MWFKTVAIILTNKCPFECPVCCYSCNPRNNSKLSRKNVFQIIDEVKHINGITTIGFTGGEPFLYLDELYDYIEYSKKNGIVATCTTNGYWAYSDKKTNIILRNLKKVGLSYLTVSFDQFHNEFVSEDNIVRICKFAKKENIKVVINCMSTKSSNGIAYIAKKLKNVFDIPIININCKFVGAAKKNLSKEEIIQEEIDIGPCENMQTLTIDYNGNIYPCCSEFIMDSSLPLGNIENINISQAIEHFFSNNFFKEIATKGFCSFEKQLDLSLYKNSKCEICNEIAKKKLHQE